MGSLVFGSTEPYFDWDGTSHNICFANIQKFLRMLYYLHMQISDLQKLLKRVPTWPKDAQEELVRSIAEIETRYTKVYSLNAEERAALKRSGDDVKRRRFASDDAVDEVFDRYHRA